MKIKTSFYVVVSLMALLFLTGGKVCADDQAVITAESITLPAAAPETEAAVETAGQSQPAPALSHCVSDETGIAFDCLPSWKLVHDGKTLKVLISEMPRVEVEIQETDQKIRFMNELSRDALASFGRYADGFHIERFQYCGRETVKVNGYLKSDPAKRVSDFYLVDHQRIHSVKFTADSPEAWEEYKFMIKQVVESVAFVQHGPEAKFLADEGEGTCEDLIEDGGGK